MELKKYKKISAKERRLNELRNIAIYQFGPLGEKLISDDTIAKGMYHRRIFSDSKQIALLNRDTGFYSLRLAGGEKLLNLGLKIVEIDFNLETNTVFAPGIIKADETIIPNDEVVIVRNDEVLAVGKAVLTGIEMEESNNGVAVRVKDRKK